MATKRTFGWVQNPNVLTTLKKVVAALFPGTTFHNEMLTEKLPLLLKNGLITKDNYQLFVELLNKPVIRVGYDSMKGKGGARGFDKKGWPKSLCSGIAQASIDAESNMSLESLDGETVVVKKPYTDDWTADGYVRWAVSTGLFDYHNEDDTVTISHLGIELVMSEDGSLEEYEAFSKALLSYPPVIRVLSILNDDGYHTKFDIGSELGFSGEMGFTSIPQEYFVADISNASSKEEASKIRSNEEGDSDKYARTICSWLQKMGWVSTKRILVKETYAGVKYEQKIMAYSITIKGKKALRLSSGYSSHPKIPKIVCFEMLATKAPDADFLRGRRARIVDYLSKQVKPKTIDNIASMLEDYNMPTHDSTIRDDLYGLTRIGLAVSFQGDKVIINDIIRNLIIPEEKFESLEITKKKEIVREKLSLLDHKYLTLIDLAYCDAKKKSAEAREFEIETASLFVDELKFDGMRLGDANRPDVIIYKGKNGAIIDNKSYKAGFSLEKDSADEMLRYVMENKNRKPGEPPNEWWKNFDSKVQSFYFLFITSFLKGKFEKNLLSISNNTGTNGGAVSIDNLLYMAEDMKAGIMTKQDFFNKMQNSELLA